MNAIRLILKSFTRSIARFPMPVLAGALAFIFLVTEIHFSPSSGDVVNEFRYVKLFLECMSAISLYIAFDIFCESQQVNKSSRLGLYLLGFCILGLHYFSITPGMFDSESIFVSRYLIFLVCFHLLVSILAFYRSTEIDAFWEYNDHLFNSFVTSMLYSLALFAGLGSALLAIDKLFDFHINPDYYIDLFAFIFLVFNTVFFLKSIPSDFAVFRKKVDFRKSIRIFVQYVLLPILAIYTIILYIYMIKIVTEQTLPNGWVCIPILVYSILGILAYLLIYPIRLEQRNQLIYFFAKYFFFILLPLLSLYFIGIIKRIMPYGITEDRYLVFMLGLWIVTISVYIIWSKVDNIIIIPVSLFMLLAVSAVGPWGMFQLSVQNQLVRLEHLLKRNHMLENGKLVKLGGKNSVSKKDAASIRSIFAYLNKRGEIDLIHPWLGDEDQDKLDSAISKNDLVYINSIFSDLGPDENFPSDLHCYLLAPTNNLLNRRLDIGGYQRITYFDCIDDGQIPVSTDTLRQAWLLNDTLVLRASADSLVKFSLRERFDRWQQFLHQQDSLEQVARGNGSNLKVFSQEDQQVVMPPDTLTLQLAGQKLVFYHVDYIRRDSTTALYQVQGYFLDQ